MKSIKELEEIRRSLDLGDLSGRNICNALIGITEHLNVQSMREVLITESAKVSSTCQQIIKEIEKIKEHMPSVENTGSGERIEGRIEGLEWVSKILSSGISWVDFPLCIRDAIVRVRDGGNLE